MNPGTTSMKIEKLRRTLSNALEEIELLDKANKDIIELSDYIWGENMNLVKFIREAELIKYARDEYSNESTKESFENIDYYRTRTLQKGFDMIHEKEKESKANAN